MGAEGWEGQAYGRGIFTRRLLLRPIEDRDREGLARLFPEMRLADDLAAASGTAVASCFAVADRQDVSLIGATACIAGTGPDATVDVFAWIGPAHSGRGFGTEATQATVDRAFGDHLTQSLWCSNRVSNTRGRRVVEKCGFQYRGTGMGRLPGLSGAVPVERFVLERRNWESLKAWGMLPRIPGGRHAGEFAA